MFSEEVDGQEGTVWSGSDSDPDQRRMETPVFEVDQFHFTALMRFVVTIFLLHNAIHSILVLLKMLCTSNVSSLGGGGFVSDELEWPQ